MKTFIQDIIVNKNINSVFDIMYNLNNNIISSSVTSLVDYQMINWYTKKKVIQKKEYMTVFINDLPVLYANFLNHTLKHINISKVNKQTFKNDKTYYIHTKCKIKNLVPFVENNTNAISSVKSICKVKLIAVGDNQTKISIKNTTYAYLPYASDIEEYIHGYVNTIYNKIVNALQ